MHSAYTARHVMDLALYAVICSRVDVVSPLRSFATCYCGLVSPTNERSRLSYKHHILSYPLACVHYRCATFIRLVVGYNLYFILVISRIVRLPALWRILRTLNSAPSPTIQARNHIVRVPDIMRVLLFGTYPHYRGCLLYTSPSPRDATLSRMPSSA